MTCVTYILRAELSRGPGVDEGGMGRHEGGRGDNASGGGGHEGEEDCALVA